MEDRATGPGLSIDSEGVGEKDYLESSRRMPSGMDSRVGLSYRSYEPLLMKEIKLRRYRP